MAIPTIARHLMAQLISNSVKLTEPVVFPLTLPPLPGDPARAIHLPPAPPAPSRLFADVLAQRRSGGIVSSAISQEQLAALLTIWHADLPAVLAPAPSLQPIAAPLILAVEGLPPAAYRYERASRCILPIAAVTRETVHRDILLQWEHGNAAVILFMVVPLASWLHFAGDRGYRAAVLQVGWMTDRLYLLAESLHLSYTASGGYALAGIDDLLGLDGYHFTTLFAFVVGGSRQ